MIQPKVPPRLLPENYAMRRDRNNILIRNNTHGNEIKLKEKETESQS